MDLSANLINVLQLADWKTLPKTQPLASGYIKFLGQEIAFANIDKALVDRAVQVKTSLYFSIPHIHLKLYLRLYVYMVNWVNYE